MFFISAVGYVYMFYGIIGLLCFSLSNKLFEGTFWILPVTIGLICLFVAFPLSVLSISGISVSKVIAYRLKPFLSGCGNVTLLYIWAPLLYFYVVSYYFSISALFMGRRRAIDKWLIFNKLNAQATSQIEME